MSESNQIQNELYTQYQELKETVRKHDYAYFVENNPRISDEEYDALYRKLVSMEDTLGYADTDSPTTHINELSSSKLFRKIRHPYRMYSLEKAHNENDITRFLKRVSGKRNELGIPERYYLDHKMDGLALELIYRNGSLSLAITRGDGYIGDDVTANVYSFVPQMLPVTNIPLIIVRGEVIVTKENLRIINDKLTKQGANIFSNHRQYASGSLRLKDPKEVAERKLSFYAWELKLTDKYIAPEEQIKILKSYGFTTSKGVVAYNVVDIDKYMEHVLSIRDTLPYEIDGIVIKQCVAEYREHLGCNDKSPLFDIAYKFPPKSMVSEILSVRWGMGRTNRLTPVAQIQPINIDGVVIKEVSLNNPDYITNNKLGINSVVEIARSGDVIPKISAVIASGDKPIDIPTKCPYCNSETMVINSGLYCTNDACPEALITNLTYIVSKEVLDIRNIGSSFVRELVTSGDVKDISDLMSMLNNPNLSEDLQNNLVTAARNIKYDVLMKMLAIPGLGKTMIRRLLAECPDLSSFIETISSPESIDELVLPETIRKAITMWATKRNIDILNKINNMKLPHIN